MATKTPADYKAPHTTGYTCQKLGFDNRRPFNMGLKSQQTAESPFKVKSDYKGKENSQYEGDYKKDASAVDRAKFKYEVSQKP